MCRLSLAVLLCLASVCARGTPLFSSDQVLELELEFPMNLIVRQAAKRPVVDGVARYVDDDGNTVTLPVRISTRGKSRLQICRFPPLSLSVEKKRAAGTIFEGQKKLKIVTHCRDGTQFLGYLLQEYSIYEAFNVLSDVSFRTRFSTITYRDSARPNRTLQEPAFFIESINTVAERNGLQRLKEDEVRPEQLSPGYSTLVALFQMLIGNTDWSNLQGPGEEGCCHNGKIVARPGAAGDWMVVPYDFDQAGLVNTYYALPDRRLGIRNVRQRLYRGRCMHAEELVEVIRLFNERRSALEQSLVRDDIRSRTATAEYVDEFFQLINDPEQRSAKIDANCVGR